MSTSFSTTTNVIVALDGMQTEQALDLAKRLSGKVWGFKVNDLLVSEGARVVTKLKALGSVFADPKLYDIPNTVSNSIRQLSDAGADLITVHAGGGPKMISAAVASASKSKHQSKILAVTVLTSFSEEESVRLFGRSSLEAVQFYADLAAGAGTHGIVCSPLELTELAKNQSLKSLLKVVPGIRPSWYGKKDDQSRTLTPRQALDAGATHLVIGRPVTDDSDPLAAVAKIEAELQQR